ncbi:Cathepsin Z [Hondaea fermentalgiana]|uniref:Cathepsin Z n=1 Tax=Hondaea fermentalgiana TaxID=2315210 RepID=A0A2R5GBB2_9STRA|nr:Cathepsin Z [Hondaea fermentalgiana]|eukprot:GBG25843.1 Cathepsin Z [Hondaea fermentalgiana]
MSASRVVLVVLAAFMAALAGASAPEAMDWRATEHGNLVTAVRNFEGLAGRRCGHVGGIWAATAMVADRLAILQPTKVKVQLSNQVLLNCLDGDACENGKGMIASALEYIQENKGVPDRTCMAYVGEKQKCSRFNTCLNCIPVPEVKCEPRAEFFRYPISSYEEVPVEAAAIRAEVAANGPIACALNDGLYGTIVAYEGETFTIKHDLGTFFGSKGFTEQSIDAIKECYAAKVELPYRYFDGEVAAFLNVLTLDAAIQYPRSIFNDGHNTPRTNNHALRNSLRAHHSEETLVTDLADQLAENSNGELPKNFSWLNYNGYAVVTPMQSHHNGPTGYCGACYAMASASVFSDRLKIMRGGANATDVFISPQNTVDCVRGPATAGCGGGDSSDVFPVWKSIGTVDETCNVWRNHEQACENKGIACRQCNGNGECSEVADGDFDVYKVKEYGFVKGEEAMMREIIARGPIDCGIGTPPALGEDIYGEDILCDNDTPPKDWEITHDISVVGWGETEDGQKYWVIRNSWGTHWGDHGFARVCRGRKQDGPGGNMKIEASCSFVVPDL